MTLRAEGSPELQKWDTIDEVELDLTKMGFSPMEMPQFPRPSIDHKLHQVLATGNGEMVTYEHARYSAWYSYSVNMSARISGRITQCENEMEILSANVKRQVNQELKAANMKIAKAEINEIVNDAIKHDSRYQVVLRDLQKHKQMLSQVDSWSKQYSAGQKLTSRAIEVRRQELESLQGGRGYDHSGGRYPG